MPSRAFGTVVPGLC